jgi:hypothetical protein
MGKCGWGRFKSAKCKGQGYGDDIFFQSMTCWGQNWGSLWEALPDQGKHQYSKLIEFVAHRKTPAIFLTAVKQAFLCDLQPHF